MGDAIVNNIAATCVPTYSISGSVTGADNNRNNTVYLSVYDDNTGTNPTKTSFRVNADGTFSFTGIPENKYYSLEIISATLGETCSATPTTPTQVTADVTDVQITCTASTHAGSYIKLQVYSWSNRSSFVSVNVFVGDTAITDTSGTPTRVVNGSDDDVTIIPNYSGLSADGFFYNVSIDNGKYYAITVTTTTGSCIVETNSSGGPITDNVSVTIGCN